MKDIISPFFLTILVLGMAFAGFIAALLAAESTEDRRKKTQSSVTWLVYMLFPAAMAAFFVIAHPIVYAIILVLLAALQLVNQEGKKRRASWNTLGIAFAIILILSAIYNRGSGFSPLMLLWIIPAVLPLIAGIVNACHPKKGEQKQEKKENKEKGSSVELRTHIVSWVIVAALAVTFIVLILV